MNTQNFYGNSKSYLKRVVSTCYADTVLVGGTLNIVNAYFSSLAHKEIRETTCSSFLAFKEL